VTLTEFVVYALATWRVASLLSEEDGPWAVFEKMRHLLGVRLDEQSWPEGKNQVAEALICIWCLTPWVGLAWALFVLVWPPVAFWCALPFALSAAAIIVNARGVRFRKRNR